MSYQDATISGSGGFSKVNTTATHSGAVACIAAEGAVWVRFLKVATAAASGANGDLANPDGGSFTDGWAQLAAGNSISFGEERINIDTETDPVAQIDVYCDGDATVVIHQH